MYKFKLKFFSIFLFIISFSFINEFTTIKVMAVPTKDEVFNNAPDGLALNGLIEHPNYKKGTNDAKLNTSFPTNIVEMLTKDGNQNQISSFWGKKFQDGSTTDLYNYFDVTKDQTISAWIYMGDVYHNYPEYSAGGKSDAYNGTMDTDKTPDGLALVLQNDDDGAQAISTAIGGSNPGSPSYGETLGVWGGSTTNHTPLSATNQSILTSYPQANLYTNKLQNGAIKNSFAVELDFLQNFQAPSLKIANILYQTIIGNDDYLDIENDYKGQHIAVGYPGDAGTYNDFSTNGFTSAFNSWSRGYYFGLKYQSGTANNVPMTGYISNNVTDANINKAWKHFTFKYKKDGSFYYALNDQERDGTAKSISQRNTGSGTIDLSKLGSSKNIRWGFTASTGSQHSAPNDVDIIMQQMPNTANVQSSVKLTDLSQYNADGVLGRDISDLNENNSFNPTSTNPISSFSKDPSYNVSNNDKLRFAYNLTYESGTLETGPIKASIKLPQNVDFKSGVSSTIGDQNIGEIVYTGIDSVTPQKISTNDIIQDTNGNNIVKLDLANMKAGIVDQKATVYLYGQADSDTTPKLVKGTPTSYRSNNYIEDITSPTFIINDQLQINTTQEDQTISLDEDATIDGTMSYVNKSTFDGKILSFTLE